MTDIAFLGLGVLAGFLLAGAVVIGARWLARRISH